MMTAHKFGLSIGLAAIGLLAAVPEVSASSANGMGGYGGRPQVAGNDNCFSENWGSVVGSCASKPGWEVVMPVNSPGSTWTPSLHVYGGLTGSITCGAVGVSNNRSSIWSAPQQTASDGPATLNYSVWVPNSGYLFTACYIGDGAEWYTVNY